MAGLTVGMVNSALRKPRISPVEWDDWRWAGSAVNPAGSASPAVLTAIAANEWWWLFVNENYMAFPDQQIPHDYAEGTAIHPHIHWAPTTSATYTGTWTLTITDFLGAATGSAKQSPLIVTAAFDAAMTAHQMQTIEFSADITGTNRTVSSCMTMTLSLALTAGTGCYLLGLDGHYQKDAVGSREEWTKNTP